MKRCSISLALREIQIKTVRYHFTPSSMAIIKKIDNTCWQEYRKIGILILYGWECKIQSLGKTPWQLFKRLNRMIYHPAIPLLGYIQKIDENMSIQTHTRMFTA